MEISIIEKNVEIAKMLGWKFERNTEHPHVFPNGVWRNNKIGWPNLHFHSDANWQFEAIDFIEAKGHPVFIVRNDVIIHKNATISSSSIWNGTTQNFNSKKEAIFEALYQFSKYLRK